MTTDDLHKAFKHYTFRTGLQLQFPCAALIDMDGTLYDSMPWHALAWYRMMSELGVETDVNEFFAYEGMTGKDTINLLFKRVFNREVSDQEAKDLYAIKSRYFIENNNAQIMPGAKQMVDCLLKNHINTVLVTGSGQASLLDRLDIDFPNAFPAKQRITSQDVSRGKPSPEPYIKGLELASVKPNFAIVIENAPLGVKSGAGASVFTIAVKTGPIPISDLKNAGADIVFDSMAACAESLPKLLYLIKNKSNI